jgi:hypothetical protein
MSNGPENNPTQNARQVRRREHKDAAVQNPPDLPAVRSKYSAVHNTFYLQRITLRSFRAVASAQ